MRENGVLTWLLADHLGSTTVSASVDGELLGAVRYSAFGEIRAASGSVGSDYLYTGQRRAGKIGLYDYQARYYDPALGRFIQADTIVPQPGNPLAWDRYAYVLNNPINLIDPSGRRPCEDEFGCNSSYKTTYTKQYYQNVLNNEFGWQLEDGFSYQETKYLYEIAWEMRLYYSNQTAGNGKGWMSKNLGVVNFIKGGSVQQAVSQLNRNPTSLVFPLNTVHLMDNFMSQGKRHVAHEVNHVVDNKMGGGLATFFGGGPADELVKFLGGTPNGLRYWNGNIDVPEGIKVEGENPYWYAWNSNADFFAESLASLIYPEINQSGMPEPFPIAEVKIWLEAVIDLSK